MESQTGIVINMGQETGIVTPWESEREIKQGVKHAEHAYGENKGRMKILKMRKQPWLLRWKSWWTGVMKNKAGKCRAKGIRKQRLG